VSRRRRPPPCPTPLKRAFTYTQANDLLAQCKTGHSPVRREKRIYLCDCTRWHLTSKEAA
jgi:hypothetical protein